MGEDKHNDHKDKSDKGRDRGDQNSGEERAKGRKDGDSQDSLLARAFEAAKDSLGFGALTDEQDSQDDSQDEKEKEK